MRLEDKLHEREMADQRANDEYMARTLCIVKLRKDGYTLREIGSALNLSHERIRQLLREAGKR